MKLLGEDGEQYTGSACLQLLQTRRSGVTTSKSVTFERAPYVFHGLYPAKYEVQVTQLAGDRPRERPSATARLWPDQLATAHVELGR